MSGLDFSLPYWQTKYGKKAAKQLIKKMNPPKKKPKKK